MSELTISPTPSDEEAAAIAAALLVAAAPPPAAAEPVVRRQPRWRFSGRWWNRPAAHSRLRPWRS